MFRVGSTKGVHTTTQIKASTEATEPSMTANAPAGEAIPAGTNFTTGYKPSSYEGAKNGEVGVLMLFSSYASASNSINQVVNKLSFLKEIPSVIVVQPNFGLNDGGKYSALKAELKGKFPKISNDPKWYIVTGQSTAGAEAFDAVWDNASVVGSAIIGSASFVCFMAKSGNSNSGYANLVKGAAKKDIRLAMVVGTCDIFPDQASRIAATCSTCTSDACVDGSHCMANWFEVNKAVAAALQEKGYEYQLLVQERGGHSIGTWTAYFADHLRFIFRPYTCGP
jgi:hypothetical protein